MDGHVFRYSKESHPRAKANALSAITFSWMIPLFWKGAKRYLDTTDLYEPLPGNKSKTQGDLLEKAWTAEVEKTRRKGGKPSYFRALWSVYGDQLICQGILIFILEFAVRLSQPFFLGGLISNITGTEEQSHIETYVYAGGLIGSSLVTALIMHSYHMGIVLTGMNMRIGTCSLIYRKVLTMKGGGRGMKGHVVNLMANDALRFDYAVTCLHDLWIAPIQIVLVTYFLYRIVGLAAFVGMAAMFAFAPLQVWMGKMTSFLREQTALKSDARINLMSEVIGGIHVIKTHAWEHHVSKLIKKARVAELNLIKRMAVVRGVMTSFQMYHTRCASALTILAYVLLGYGTLSAYTVFMLTAFFGVLGTTVGVFFPTGILLVSECYTSVRRVEDFLVELMRTEQPSLDSCNKPLSPERSYTSGQKLVHPGNNLEPNRDECLVIENVASKWPTSDEPVLHNVTVKASPGQLTVVLGSVGAGKTSLLHTVLGELELTNGAMNVPKTVSYVSQEPWLFPGSIRKNILFGETFDQEKYDSVVKTCALLPDIDALKWGDWTKVGERGVSLSGGQKARVNLARAVYKDADVYLLDDPLSAVDCVVRSQLFEHCIRPLSRRKIVVLVTHSLEHLRPEDHVVILENGRVKHDGSLDDVDLLKSLESQLTEHTEVLSDDPVEITSRTGAIHRASATTSASKSSLADETSKNKTPKLSSLGLFFSASGCPATIAFISFIVAQTFGSASDYWVSFWVNLEENSYNSTGFAKEIVKRVPFEIDRQFCLWVFGTLISGTLTVSILRSLVYFFACIRASRILHKKMFHSVISAKMKFYYTTKSGSIMSRFSKDQGTVDEHFPITFMDFLQIGLSAIGILLVIPATNYWLIVPTVVILIIFYALRIVYVRTTKGLREIEGQARSPLFTHVGCTLDGLVTIHSRKAQSMVKDQFDSLQDFHTSAWYLYLAANRAFAFWLDIFCVIYNTVVTLSFVIFPNGILVADVGLAITQCSGLAYTMEWGLRQSAEVENSLVSVKRLHDYCDLEREAPYVSDRGLRVVKDWPVRGAIDFIDVYMRYDKASPWVLKGLSFSISPGQKAGIVGRTGSGKSSIALALFRLVDYEGSIKIDGVDIGVLGLHDFRPKITVIPQDPDLFAGTIRSNLDPLEEYGDAEIWDALRKVEMVEFVSEHAGLSMTVSERGGNLSTGQKQLLCLARGLLRSNKIVVLDEATANVDEKTEEVIQRAIKINFKDATVITIAHRLRTVMDSDIIMVVDSGRIKQSGPPHQLLDDTRGPFYSMMREANASMFLNG